MIRSTKSLTILYISVGGWTTRLLLLITLPHKLGRIKLVSTADFTSSGELLGVVVLLFMTVEFTPITFYEEFLRTKTFKKLKSPLAIKRFGKVLNF